MDAPRLGVIVSYSSNERMFLEAQVTQLSALRAELEAGKIGLDIVYSVGSHLFSGDEEIPPSVFLLGTGGIRLTRYTVDPVRVAHEPRVYHNLARAAGLAALPPQTDWVLFLDADEIPEGRDFGGWFRTHLEFLQRQRTLSFKLACYWYFKDPRWRARSLEDSIVLVHRDTLRARPDALQDSRERDGIADAAPGGCMRWLANHLTGNPMFHHFSWVREREHLLRKVLTWGHKHDKVDWHAVVDSIWELDCPGPGGDPIHGYSYDVLDHSPFPLPAVEKKSKP